jgi:hypothetical protein
MKQFQGCKFFEKVARGFTGARINRPLFSVGCSVFFVFVSFLYPKKSQNSTQKKRKKSQISIGRTNYKILPISVSKDSEISPGKKNTGWVQYFLFSQFYYLA